MPDIGLTGPAMARHSSGRAAKGMAMQDRAREIEVLYVLYRQAFARFGPVALWNMRPVEHPTIGSALVAVNAALTFS